MKLNLGIVSGLALVATTVSAACGAATDVMIMHFQFMPGDITVEVGTTVRWTNMDSTEHSVTSQTEAGTLILSGEFDQFLNPGESFSYTFSTPGVYHYFCIPHGSSMQGVVRVVPGTPCAGDFDGDSDSDSDDVIGFFFAWESADLMADVDGDDDTDSDDIVLFFLSWDNGC